MRIASPSSASESQQALARRLHRLSAAVQALVALGALVLLAWPLLLAFTPLSVQQSWLGPDGNNLLHLLRGPFTSAVRWRLALSSLFSIAVGLAVLWQLWSLFGQYRRGAVFGAAALLHLRRFGWWLLALAVVEPVSRSLATVAISLDNPPGQRMLVLSLGSSDYTVLLLALVFIAIARVMAEAAREAEENRQFV